MKESDIDWRERYNKLSDSEKEYYHMILNNFSSYIEFIAYCKKRATTCDPFILNGLAEEKFLSEETQEETTEIEKPVIKEEQSQTTGSNKFCRKRRS